MHYKACLDILYSLRAKGIKSSLQTARLLSQALHFPEKSFKSIHIAGTNGKGSVATKIAACLERAGYRVGLYTSPHITSFRERICINGEMISEEDVTRALEKLFSFNIPATFFAYTTILAFDYFAKKKVDIAVLETGLGGRLDATNICEPILTVITSINLDHTQVLGDTVEQIAREKAGILKWGVPLVIGPHVPRGVMQEVATALDISLYTVDEEVVSYEEENQLVAKKALKVLENDFNLNQESIESGIEAVPPCRFQLIKGVIFDVAHNVNGVQRLFARLNQPVCVLCGFSQDKDVESCLREIMKHAEAVFFVETVSERAMPTKALFEMAQKIDPDKICFTFSDISEGMKQATKYAGDCGQLLVVCGTFFIMDDCRRTLVMT